MVRAFLTSLAIGGRLTPVAIRLAGSKFPSVALGGCRLPAQEARYHLSLTIPVPPVSYVASEGGTASGLLDKDAFARLASEAVNSHQPYTVTLLDVAGLEKMRARVSGELASGLVQGIGRQLQARSVNGSSAGELADGRFGVLHEGALDLKGLVHQITAFSKSVDPEGEGVDVSGMTVAPGESGLGEDDAARVLIYAINRFRRLRRRVHRDDAGRRRHRIHPHRRDPSEPPAARSGRAPLRAWPISPSSASATARSTTTKRCCGLRTASRRPTASCSPSRPASSKTSTSRFCVVPSR